ncbi:hypothetical protein DFH07DRAFT_777019 [Mycena maculata]|uniref:Uncharacterized protein n=1 Tax=Mycena maculata TaxID=230809 RepID=A0AAD7N4U1_9AGAR|nr:hypothetical protein DFH07DRAFT_777019 [Mycena maculata]
MYRKNNTKAYVAQNLQSAADQAFLRGAAGQIDGEGRERKQHLEQAEADERMVTEHRAKKVKSDKKKREEQRKIDKCPVIFDVDRFQDPDDLRKIIVEHIDLQLKWHRSREILADTKPEIPATSKLNKSAKVEIIIAALERWNPWVEVQEFPQGGPLHPPEDGDDSKIESESEEEDIGYRD